LDRRRFRPQAVLTALLVVVVGCGLFEPRQPHQITVLPPPLPCRVRSNPDSVLENIVVQYGKATDCYASQLADSTDPTQAGFHFYPDAQDYATENNPPSPNPFDGWNQGVEISVTQFIATRIASISLSFDSSYAAPTTSTNPTRETRYLYYHLRVVSTAGDSTRYQGQAELTMLLGQNQTSWALETFRDHRDTSGLPTWGIFRAQERLALGH
jgi:hypothetical protein